MNWLQQQLQEGKFGLGFPFCDGFILAYTKISSPVASCPHVQTFNSCVHVAFVVGLERVAEELMGRRKWKLYQDAVLKTPLKIDVEDWEPQDKCCMCDGRAFLDSATVSTRHSF